MGMFGAYLLAALNPAIITDVPRFRGMNYAMGGYNPIYKPKRTKFKGYMKERKRYSFNKNR